METDQLRLRQKRRTTKNPARKHLITNRDPTYPTKSHHKKFQDAQTGTEALTFARQWNLNQYNREIGAR